MDDVDGAITREEVRKLIHEKIIVSLPEKGVSRSRAKTIRSKKHLGRRSGPGSITGAGHAKVTKKDAWMIKFALCDANSASSKQAELSPKHLYTIL